MAKKDDSAQDAEVVEKRTPDAWRDELFGNDHPRALSDRWKHSAAEALHKWKVHEHHEGKAIELSLSDYQAALTAACTTNDSGAYVPHAAALSRHAGKA